MAKISSIMIYGGGFSVIERVEYFMQGYRKPKTFSKHKNLITVILISLIMVGIAVYFTVLKNNEQNARDLQNNLQNQPPADTISEETEPSAQTAVETIQPPAEETTTPPQQTEAPQQSEQPETPAQTEPAEIELMWPCDSMNIGQEYFGLTPVFSETLQDWRAHPAIDIVTEKPENVYAAADGIVEDVYTDGLMGNTVLIRHSDGIYTIYQSLDENPKVLKNMEVKKGDVIGKTGTSASAEESMKTHLHFSMIENGNNCDPASRMEDQNTEQPPTETE